MNFSWHNFHVGSNLLRFGQTNERNEYNEFRHLPTPLNSSRFLSTIQNILEYVSVRICAMHLKYNWKHKKPFRSLHSYYVNQICTANSWIQMSDSNVWMVNWKLRWSTLKPWLMPIPFTCMLLACNKHFRNCLKL